MVELVAVVRVKSEREGKNRERRCLSNGEKQWRSERSGNNGSAITKTMSTSRQLAEEFCKEIT